MADYRAMAVSAARAAGIPPAGFVAQIQAESGFNPNAVSPAGAIGIAQIIPSTAAAWGVNPRDPAASLNAAARHMGQSFRQYGNWRDALSVYNSGRPWAQGQRFSETRNYVGRLAPIYERGGPVTAVAPGGTKAPVVAALPKPVCRPRRRINVGSALGLGASGPVLRGRALAIIQSRVSCSVAYAIAERVLPRQEYEVLVTRGHRALSRRSQVRLAGAVFQAAARR